MTIVHVLADGTRLTDITDRVIPVQEAEVFYQIITKLRGRLTNGQKKHNRDIITTED